MSIRSFGRGRRKRQRVASSQEEEDRSLLSDLPSDTEAALFSLRASFPHDVESLSHLPPVVLKTQVVSVVADHAEVDREIERLRQTGQLRVFDFLGGVEDRGLVLTSDLLATVRSRQASGSKSVAHAAHEIIIQLLARPQARGMMIPRVEIEDQVKVYNEKVLGGHGSVLVETVSSQIQKIGFAIQNGDGRELRWSIPNLGPFLQMRRTGNSELLRLLARQRYKEMMLRECEQYHLRTSQLGTEFHVQDLTGMGTLTISQTTAGKLLGLSPRR